MEDAISQMKVSRRTADLFELRLDLIRNPDIIGLLGASGRPVITTCRTVAHGGKFRGAAHDRLTMLRLASALGSAYIDLEYPQDSDHAAEMADQKNEAGIILSHHTNKRPAKSLLASMSALHPSVVKLAYHCSDSFEIRYAIDFLQSAAKAKQPAVAIATGEAGEASRVLYRKFGGWGTFAAPEAGSPAADGQIPASVLRKTFRADTLGAGTRVFGVIGTPLVQSRGTELHNPLFRRASVNAVYCRFPVKNLSRFMADLAPFLDGFSVTIPHKGAIVSYLDNVDPDAAKIGAVNTVVRQSGGLRGTNTDGIGALDALEESGPVRGMRMLVMGAGGAARAIIWEARARGARVCVANRTAARARKLAKEFGVEVILATQIGRTEFDILVNATSLGMVPRSDVSPFQKRYLTGKRVFDVVFNPPVTRLMTEAKQAAATVIPGTEMYVRQAAEQSLLYAGRKPSLRSVRKMLGYDA